MFYTEDEIMEYIEEEDAKFIRLAFRDAFGVQKNISVMPSEIHKAFKYGIPINARAILGFECSGDKNLYLRPDPATTSILPWRPDTGRVIRMYCDVCTADGEPFESDTRYILKQAVKKAEEAGIEFRFGSEMEFYLFKCDDEGRPTKIPYDEAGYMDIAPLDRGENIRREICLTIEEMGLTPERSHHERGPGQNEIDFHYGKPLKAADQMTTFKMVVSTIADRNGLYADFSPVPISDKPGNGYHINLFAKDSEGADVAKFAAAGIIDKICDITLFLNPTDESYTRFGRSTAPDRVKWSSAGDTELMYISEYQGSTRVELRSPDALSNPYIVYALLIHAGLYGIENRLSLPKEMDDEGILLPENKKTAIKKAQKSEFIKSIIPQEIIDKYSL
ncbi:MAG: glutamine synthetase family protein [Eubacterium sp.]|nr:glutamine synthetase family protein [Eubacterium sp.]